MAVLSLASAFNPIVEQPSENVKEITAETRQFLEDMLDTLRHQEGVTGLAAIQCGRKEKLIVIDGQDGTEPLKLINARILWYSPEQEEKRESCLTYSDYSNPMLVRPRAIVFRSKEVDVEYQDENGKRHKKRFSGVLAWRLQHEIEHTEGKPFVDRLPVEIKEEILRELKEAHNPDSEEPVSGMWRPKEVKRKRKPNGEIEMYEDGFPKKTVADYIEPPAQQVQLGLDDPFTLRPDPPPPASKQQRTPRQHRG